MKNNYEGYNDGVYAMTITDVLVTDRLDNAQFDSSIQIIEFHLEFQDDKGTVYRPTKRYTLSSEAARNMLVEELNKIGIYAADRAEFKRQIPNMRGRKVQVEVSTPSRSDSNTYGDFVQRSFKFIAEVPTEEKSKTFCPGSA